MNNYYVYVYLDPRKPGRYTYDNFVTFFFEPFYVGKGHYLRDVSHIKVAMKRKNWKHKRFNIIRAAIAEGHIQEHYVVRTVDNVLECQSLRYEEELIRRIGREDKGCGPLSNLTDGGDGVSGLKHSDEARKKMSDNHKGQVPWNKGTYVPPAKKEKKDPWNKGKKHSEETIAKLKEARKNRAPESEETKAKRRASLQGRTLSEDHKRKVSDALSGKSLSDDHRKALSESHKGKKLSDEHIRKISEANKGRKVSPEGRARMSAAAKNRAKR